MNNYQKFRGRCKELSEELVRNDPSLRLVRGFYHEPTWGTKEGHWWCVDQAGNIIDPSKDQFPTGGIIDCYEEFDGTCECADCGKRFEEKSIGTQFMSNYAFCSTACAMSFVGL